MKNFKLINPVIIGKMKTTFETNTAIDAAQEFWNELTSNNYIANNIPQFLFTLENNVDNEFHHFLVKENLDAENSKLTNFTIKEVNVDLTDKQKKIFLSEVEKIHSNISKSQSGGKKHRNQRKQKRETPTETASEQDVEKVEEELTEGRTHRSSRSSRRSRRSRSRDDDSSSSSSDDDNEYIKRLRVKTLNNPISFWWYNNSIYDYRTIFTPTFLPPLWPYISNWSNPPSWWVV